VLAQAKVKVSTTSQTWEPQRAYERRLSNIMSKTKGLLHKSHNLVCVDVVSGAGSKPRGRAANKPRELATSDEESGEQSGEEVPPPPPPQDPATQPPRPRPAYRTRSRSAEVDAMGGEDRSEAEATSSPAADKKRSASSARARRSQSQSQSRSVSRSKQPRRRSSAAASEGARSARSSPEGEITPKASRKRARAAARHEKKEGSVVLAEGGVDEEEGGGVGLVTPGVEHVLNEERTASSSSPARPASRESSAGAPEEFQVRRKRARH
jgi:cohesin complex subunit SA-1/2